MATTAKQNPALVAIEKAKKTAAQNIETTNVDADVTTPVTTSVTTTEKKLSPKAKASRGVAEHLVTTWVDVNNEPDFNSMLKRVAKTRDCSVVQIYQKIIADAMTPELIAILKEDADKAPEPKTRGVSLEGMSEDKLLKAESDAAKKLEAIKAKMAEIKARRATQATTPDAKPE